MVTEATINSSPKTITVVTIPPRIVRFDWSGEMTELDSNEQRRLAGEQMDADVLVQPFSSMP